MIIELDTDKLSIRHLMILEETLGKEMRNLSADIRDFTEGEAKDDMQGWYQAAKELKHKLYKAWTGR